MSRQLRAVTHVLFDMDGLLLNTESLYTAASKSVLEEYGKTYSYEMKSRLMGRKQNDVAKEYVEHFQLPISPEEYVSRVNKINCESFPSAQLMPGIAKLVHHLYKKNVPMAVATSSHKEALDLKLTNHGEFFKMFHHIVTGDDPEVKESKPAPDIFKVCAARFDVPVSPSDCLVLEDSPNGVQAGNAAGMQTVMIPHPWMTDNFKQEATVVVDSALDFKPEVFGLPPFDYQPVSHIIFDMDGLLLDTSNIYRAAGGSILAKHGKTSCPKLRMDLVGMRWMEAVDKILSFYELPYTRDEYHDLFMAAVGDKMAACQFLDGVVPLLKHLHRQGIPMAVATSSDMKMFESKTVRHKEVFAMFDHIITGCHPEVKHGKPAPDIFKVAADKFPSKPDYNQCLVFEDAANGARAAADAGMQCVMIPYINEYTPDLTLPASQLLTSMREFNPREFGLPPFED